jgi:hypothetical protein
MNAAIAMRASVHTRSTNRHRVYGAEFQAAINL